jgi:hypothetical protein
MVFVAQGTEGVLALQCEVTWMATDTHESKKASRSLLPWPGPVGLWTAYE